MSTVKSLNCAKKCHIAKVVFCRSRFTRNWHVSMKLVAIEQQVRGINGVIGQNFQKAEWSQHGLLFQENQLEIELKKDPIIKN